MLYLILPISAQLSFHVIEASVLTKVMDSIKKRYQGMTFVSQTETDEDITITNMSTETKQDDPPD